MEPIPFGLRLDARDNRDVQKVIREAEAVARRCIRIARIVNAEFADDHVVTAETLRPLIGLICRDSFEVNRILAKLTANVLGAQRKITPEFILNAMHGR